MSMPFAPCTDAACTDDTSVEILKWVFGPVINGLLNGGDTSKIETSANILATMFSVYASGIMIVAGFIVSGVVMGSVMNTANDGEVMGKNWSTPNTIMRVVSGGGVLLPTASGFSIIQLIVLMLALWGVGFANLTYRTGMTMGLLSPAGIVSNAAAPGSYYGMREFAKQYMGAMYCARAANAAYTMASGSRPSVQLNGGAGTPIGSRMEYSFAISDTNSATNLAGGAPICGVVKLSLYSAQNLTDPTEKALDSLRVAVQQQKYTEVQSLMADIKSFVDSWPTSINADGWDRVDSSTFNDIVKRHEDRIATQLLNSLSQQQGAMDKGMETYLNDTLSKGGWASAGGWFQRVGMARGTLAQIFAESVGSVSAPTTSGLPQSEQTREFASSVNTIPYIVQAKADGKLPDDAKRNLTAESLNGLLPKDIDDSINISTVQQNMASAVSRWTNGMMEAIVGMATGAGNDGKASAIFPCGSAGEIGGSINRMKCVGDYLTLQYVAVLGTDAFLKTSATGARIAAGVVSGGKFLGTGLEVDKVVTPFWDWMMAVPIRWLSTIGTYLQTLAFYFGVIIPTFPYTVFMIVVVGWILAVLQTCVAAPLWAVMHMTPDRTFIGSQTQGYLMLLALFVRPALAVLGLFASMLISDPIITYIAKAFFTMHRDVASSTGAIGSVASIVTFFWWLIVFGLTLMPVLWMTYGLPQALPDEVLRWISAGIGDLGASAAIPEVRGGHQNAQRMVDQLSNGPRTTRIGGPERPRGGTPPNGGPGGGRGGGSGRNETLLSVNQQGVTPSPTNSPGSTS
ncbi:DotA/TraY family protein [Bordetella flabilis]|uniref:Type IV secretion system protein DotA-like protein n=1 Tax=Bordetella flabilis TaxID=463014 RepID=A0A193GLT8_9BORD|nr:DotA/TraY family protein [Bordetella flabilis]ANN80835.1 hypothetical protein BAU07_26280 [Bordetella flabilis]